jgi:two-component sensor histidine kinase
VVALYRADDQPSAVETAATVNDGKMKTYTGIATEFQADIVRNWIWFALVTCLLTVLTLAFKTSLLRAPRKENNGFRPKKPNPPDSAEPRSKPCAYSEETKLTPPGKGFYRNAPPHDPHAAEERLHMALESGGICAWEWHRARKGSIVYNGASCASLLKCPSDKPMTARAILRRIPPHERRRLLGLVRAALTKGRGLTADVRFRRFDGGHRWFALRAKPLRDDSGRVDGLIGIAQDITDQKQSLSRTDSLLREVSHRSKNMLALILAMARLSARDAVDVKSHLKEFTLRVAGLAASQDLIVAADWQNVDFSTLASAEIEAVARSDAMRVNISGPPLLVTPEAAQTLGMILTELTLNAVTHGALSTAAGEVHLSWAFERDATITISWRETGGPEYHADRPKGYGMSVVERFSTQGLRLEARVSSEAEGFSWTLSGPLANIGARAPQNRT